MDILYKLSDDKQVYGVMLSDNGSSYPAFIESLHHKKYIELLIAGGWQFCGFPYDFRKGDTTLDSLPSMPFTPTADVEQQMWDSLDAAGMKLSMDQLKAYIASDAVSTTAETGDYMITTREDFINFLDMCPAIESSRSILPLNYFVHPDALFTPDEYFSEENYKYRTIIEKRRQMSLSKFKELIAFLKLPDAYKPIDVVYKYLSWGVDGINDAMLDIHKDETATMLGTSLVNMSSYDSAYVYEKLYAIYDSTGLKLPPDVNPDTWRTEVSREKFMALCQDLGPGEVKPITVKKQILEDIVVVSCRHFNLRADCSGFFFEIPNNATGRVRTVRSPSISVYTNHDSSDVYNSSLWTKEGLDSTITLDYAYAISKYMYERFKDSSDVSSYKALLASGLSPLSALLYISGQVSSNKALDPLTEDANEVISFSPTDAQNYVLTGEDANVELFVKGELNIDGVDAGRQGDMYSKPAHYVKYITTANKYLHLPMDEIYKIFREVPDDATEIVLRDPITAQHMIVPIYKSNGAVSGYKSDIKRYRLMQADNATEYLFVLEVAREIGDINADRHIALKAGQLFKNDTVKTVIDTLLTRYHGMVIDNVQGRIAQEQYEAVAMEWVIPAMMMSAIYGFSISPKFAGGGIVMEPYVQEQLAPYLEYVVDDTVSICDTMLDSSGGFRRYVANAIVTPYHVIARPSSAFDEYTLISQWEDYTDPGVVEKLRSANLRPAGFQPWSLLAYKHSAIQHVGEPPLVSYVRQSRELLGLCKENGRHFLHGEHLADLAYPAMIDEVDNTSAEPVASSMAIGVKNTLDENATSKWLPQISQVEQQVCPNNKFFGFNADDFQDPNTCFNIPTATILDDVRVDSYSVYCKEQEVKVNSTTASWVSHIRGNDYLVCDSGNTLWRVSIV